MNFTNLLKENEIKVSVPCRVDLGGTLDISTFYLPLYYLKPSSFNIAVNLRTFVTLSSYKKGYVKISSRGFESAQFEIGKAPFDHPMGLMFALAAFFNIDGVHIQIESSSPPRSALGGSSSAGVAICAALMTAMEYAENKDNDHTGFDKSIDPEKAAWIAHYIESSVAGVPCGMQDQLAAAFGGVSQWFWKIDNGKPSFLRKQLLVSKEEIAQLNKSFLVAYCGIPHVSRDVNKKWVNQFLCGANRDKFEKIVNITSRFSKALQNSDYSLAGKYMNQETELRLEMTPQVLDDVGKLLFKKACDSGAGLRFTGAGGGGCVWAIGSEASIQDLKTEFIKLLKHEKDAKVLDTTVDSEGIIIY